MKWALKLFLAFLLIVVVTVSAASLYSTAAIGKAFQDYMQHSISVRTEMTAALILEYYKANGWQDIQTYVQGGLRGRGPGMGMGMGNMMQNRRFGMGVDRYLIIDETGKIIADTNGSEIGRILEQEQLAKGVQLMIDEKPIGALVSYSGYGQLEQAFVASARRANLMAGFAALLVSLVLAYYLSSKISRPLIALSKGAKHIASRDMSYRIQGFADDEIGAAAQSFNQMAEKLESNEQVRKNMLADIAHELRTPLAILRGNLESLQDGVVQPSPAVFASLHDEAVRMSNLVCDLQDISLAEAGELKLRIQCHLLTEIVNGIYSNLASEASSRNIRLLADIPAQMAVAADYGRLEQVFYNLLTNALKHTPYGGTVSITAIIAGGQAEIAIEDSGCGIAAEELPYIFDRFYRSDKSRSRETGGTGLGLAITKSLVEAHGGQIWAESQTGMGSKFVFTVPLAKRIK